MHVMASLKEIWRNNHDQTKRAGRRKVSLKKVYTYPAYTLLRWDKRNEVDVDKKIWVSWMNRNGVTDMDANEFAEPHCISLNGTCRTNNFACSVTPAVLKTAPQELISRRIQEPISRHGRFLCADYAYSMRWSSMTCHPAGDTAAGSVTCGQPQHRIISRAYRTVPPSRGRSTPAVERAIRMGI